MQERITTYLDHWRRISDTGCFNQDTIKLCACLAALDEATDDLADVSADGAADAAIVEFHAEVFFINPIEFNILLDEIIWRERRNILH